MFSSWITKLLLIVIGILFSANVYFYFANKNLKSDLTKSQTEARQYRQNLVAAQDELKMKKNIIQDYAVQVKNLQNEKNSLKHEIQLLKTNFNLLLDSIEVLNKPAETHNFGDSIKVTFQGKQGRISYKGYTTYFVLPDSGTYSLTLSQDPLKIESVLYYNDSTDIVYNKIFADSVLIDSAKTVMDSTFFNKFFNPENQLETVNTFWQNLSVLLEMNGRFKQLQQFKTLNTLFELKAGVRYRFNSGLKIELDRDLINGEWIGGVGYEYSIKDLWKLIF